MGNRDREIQPVARGKPLFARQLTIGQCTENRISNWLIKDYGWHILPVYEKEGGDFKGPRFFTPETELVAPDILAIRNSKMMWAEAKHKTVFSWHRKTQRWVTGIDVHHYEDYLRVHERTPNFQFWLLFLHETARPDARDVANGCPPACPTGLFGGSLPFLAKNENHRHDNWGKSGMVYWDVNTLKKLADVRNGIIRKKTAAA